MFYCFFYIFNLKKLSEGCFFFAKGLITLGKNESEKDNISNRKGAILACLNNTCKFEYHS